MTLLLHCCCCFYLMRRLNSEKFWNIWQNETQPKHTVYFYNFFFQILSRRFFETKNTLFGHNSIFKSRVNDWCWVLATLYLQAPYLLSDNESYCKCNQGRFPLLTESAFTQLSDHKLYTGFFLFIVFASFLQLCAVPYMNFFCLINVNISWGHYGHDHQCARHTNLLFYLLELPEIVFIVIFFL